MMAQPFKLAVASPPPAPRGVRWIDLQAAAARSGMSVERLRQRCEQQWQGVGLARKQIPEGGGKAQWFIREDAEARLGRVQFPEQLPVDLGRYTHAQQQAMLQKLKLLQEWEAVCASALQAGQDERAVAAAFLAKLEADTGLHLHLNTLRNWRKAYRADGLAGLSDGRWKAEGERVDDAHPFLAEAKRLYLMPNRLKIATCHTIACLKAKEQGWPIVSYKTTGTFLRSLPAAVVQRYRFGEKLYTDEAEPFVERDYSTLRSNELWCADHHVFDVLVDVGGKRVRPWLTCFEDVRSRKVVGWHIAATDPNTDTILYAFAAGVKAHGVPEGVYVDNGKDFDAAALQGVTKRQRRQRIEVDEPRLAGVFTWLGVTVRHAEPYHGQSKPVERLFGTLADQFSRTWPTYTGSKPENKPEGLADRLEKGQAPTLEEFVAGFVGWLALYHDRVHLGDGMEGRTPNQVFEACLEVKRTVPEDRLAVLLLKQSRPVKVTQNGVVYEGIRYGVGEPALFEWLGKEVRLHIDPRDVSRVWVFSLEGQRIGLAHATARIPFQATQEDIRAAKSRKKRYLKLTAEYNEARPRLHEDMPDLVLRAMAERNQQQTPPPPQGSPIPPVLKPVRTPIDDQFSVLQRELKQDALRPAVGAESMSLLDLGREMRQQPKPEPAARDPFAQLSAKLRSES